jgi:putative transposase
MWFDNCPGCLHLTGKKPVSRACKIVSLPRSQYYYHSGKDEHEVIEALHDLEFQHPKYGFRKLSAYLRRSGKAWNHKKVYRCISY